MNALHVLLLVLLITFVGGAIVSRKSAMNSLRLVLLLGITVVMLLPFAWLVCAAFKDNSVLSEYVFLPPFAKLSSATINLSNFRTLFTPRESTQGVVGFWRYVQNSLFLASAGTFISALFSSMGGYALAKFNFRGRGALLTYMLASMAVPGVVLLAPNFAVIYSLGWMDSYRAILIPTCVSAFGIFLFRQAMLAVPDELIEAGRIDGCSEFRIYFSLVMPLVRPMTSAFCLISFLGAWNSYLMPNVFLQTQSKLTLPVVLNQFMGVYERQYGVFLAGTLLAILPPALLFLALQREFISGLTSGAVKQ
ncbi:MAG: carbohydrate ABC transporter permease [Tepidisphaeraceae bacterium]